MDTADQAFKWAAEFVLEAEGVMSDHADDPGGLTKFGISQRWHPGVDVASLTGEGALEIYRAEYWERAGCDVMPESLALMVFDGAVNQGTPDAVRWVQRALDLKADGIAGPVTRGVLVAHATAPAARRRDILVDVLSWRALEYAGQAIKSPASYSVNARGWFRRLALVGQTAAIMSLGEGAGS